MGLKATRGTCPGCTRIRMLRSRGLCKACYYNPAIRESHKAIPNTRFRDLSGQRFGRLVVIGASGLVDRFGKRTWLCECDCGTTTPPLATGALTSGNTTSCGCWKLENTGDVHRTHGKSRTAEYRIWVLMRLRCNNPENDDYHHYGGRGIRVCVEWDQSFEVFLREVGYRPQPGMSINRINNQGNYEPGNVRWATQKEQCRNKRTNHLLTFNGETMCIVEWAERTGVSDRKIWGRIRRGWTPERTLTTP